MKTNVIKNLMDGLPYGSRADKQRIQVFEQAIGRLVIAARIATKNAKADDASIFYDQANRLIKECISLIS